MTSVGRGSASACRRMPPAAALSHVAINFSGDHSRLPFAHLGFPAAAGGCCCDGGRGSATHWPGLRGSVASAGTDVAPYKNDTLRPTGAGLTTASALLSAHESVARDPPLGESARRGGDRDNRRCCDGVGESRPAPGFACFGDVFRNWYLIVCEYDDMMLITGGGGGQRHRNSSLRRRFFSRGNRLAHLNEGSVAHNRCVFFETPRELKNGPRLVKIVITWALLRLPTPDGQKLYRNRNSTSPLKTMAEMEVFVPGRLCILGEHSDWMGEFRDVNPTVSYGMTVVCATNEGLYARCRGSTPGRLTFSFTLPDGKLETLDAPMDVAEITRMAAAGGFFSYVVGTAAAVITAHFPGGAASTYLEEQGIHINNYRTTLPMRKGLSSSAAVCVLVAKCFNEVRTVFRHAFLKSCCFFLLLTDRARGR